MKQVINFYEKLEPRKSLPKSLIWIGAGLGVVVAVYSVWTMVLFGDQRGLDKQLVDLSGANKIIEGKIRLEEKKSQLYNPDVLNARLGHLRKQRYEKQLLLANLRDPKLTNIRGFSNVLTALARQHRQGVAIEKIELTENGALFSMEGEVENPLDLPAYILRLGQEEVFWGMSFETIKIAEMEARLSFALRSWSKS